MLRSGAWRARADHFGHYRKLVWLAQARDTAIDQQAARIAGRFGLPLRVTDIGTGSLEREREQLLAAKACAGQRSAAAGSWLIRNRNPAMTASKASSPHGRWLRG